MKKLAFVMLSVTSLLFLVNMTSDDSSVNNEKKPSINISATITIRDGNTMEIEYLQINHKIKDIMAYDLPDTGDIEPGTNILKKDPRKGPRTEINIAPQNTYALEVPNPDKKWIFPREKFKVPSTASGAAIDGTEFIEVVVISSNENKTKNSYAMEIVKDKHQDIQADQVIKGAGSNPKSWPFYDVKKIVITGLQHRDEKPKLTNDLKSCPPPPPAVPCACPEIPTPVVK